MRKSKVSITSDDIFLLREDGKTWKEIGETVGLSIPGMYLYAKRIGYTDPETITRYKRSIIPWSEKRKIKKVPCTLCGIPTHTGKCPSCALKENRYSGYHAQKKGPESPWWKGEDAGYDAKHQWIVRTYGRPKKCENCLTEDPDKRYEWANVSGAYHRERTDYMRLCKSCHTKYDNKRGPATKHLEELDRWKNKKKKPRPDSIPGNRPH